MFPRSLRGSRRRKPVKWLSARVLYTSAREAATARQFARYADARASMASSPSAWFDLTKARGIDSEAPFVLDYAADTGDGFDATYAIARCLTGEPLPDDPALAARNGGRRHADLLVLGGDSVYPVASVSNYEERFKSVFDLADPPRVREGTDSYTASDTDSERSAAGGVRYPERPRYLAATPGNHDWYDGLVAFRSNFCASWLDGPSDRVSGASIVPRPTRDVVVGRYPFQARSYYAVKLPHGWWLWGIDIQLDAQLDEAQMHYFRLAREQVDLAAGERVILCTARPAWLDPAQPALGYESNRGRLAWFVNRMFGNDEGVDPDTGADPGDHLDAVPLVFSGDLHAYLHHTRTDADAENGAPPVPGRESAPEHLVTCGGGGAFLSSTHHHGDVSMPWHLAEPGTPYALRGERAAYPSRETSRTTLSRRFYRIPFVNGLLTPALVLGILAALSWSVRGLVSTGSTAWGVAAGVLTATVGAITTAIAVGFRQRHLPWWRQYAEGLLLAGLHTAGYLVVVAASVYSARYVEPAWFGELASAAVLAGGGLFAFGGYWFLADRLGWHENEFFVGMGLDDYKSFVRIAIAPPARRDSRAAGALTVTAYGVREIPRNRSRSGPPDEPFVDPVVEIIERWTVGSGAGHPSPTPAEG
ncbi:MAG: hypothetical protein ACRCYQ_14380 [Nocardioides sp.]